MAKHIIILDRPEPGSYRFVFWADVPVSRQPFYANAAFVSAYKDATAGEKTALTSGVVTERVGTINIGAMSLAQVQTSLQNTWQAFQDEVNNINPWQRFGTFWDGATWTAGGVS